MGVDGADDVVGVLHSAWAFDRGFTVDGDEWVHFVAVRGLVRAQVLFPRSPCSADPQLMSFRAVLQSASSFGYAECAALVVGECADHIFDAPVVVVSCKPLAPGVDVVCVWFLEHEVEDTSRLARENGGAAVPHVVSVEEDITFLCLYVDFGVVE